MTDRTSNRDALLVGAIQCLQERGYGRTTARDLVAASGTNLGAIGYHFGSKEALLNEALAECSRSWLRQLTALASTVAGDGMAWEATITAVERAVAADRPLAVGYLEAWTQSQRSPELRDQLAVHYRQFRSATAELVKAAASERDLPASDQAALSAVLVALVDGLIVQWLLEPDAVPGPAELARVLAPLVKALE